MKWTRTSLLTAVCLMALLAVGVAGAATINVPTDQATISAAISAANPLGGDTILVDGANYSGNIIIDRPLILKTTLGGTITGSGGAAITVNADNVEINGFTITNPMGTQAIYANDHSHLWFHDNVITNVGDGATAVGVQSIAVICTAVDVDDVVIEDNSFSYIYGGPNNSMSAMSIGWSNGANMISGLVVQNNTIAHLLANTSDWPVGHGAYGILINHGTGTTGQTLAPQILNNDFSDIKGFWAHAIGLEGNTPNAVVSGNTIDNIIDTKEALTGVPDAAAVKVEDNASMGSVTITGNSFTNVTLGVINAVTGLGSVNAEGNYWGAISGPYQPTTNSSGTGVAASDLVDYSPWYGLPLGSAPMTIGTNDVVQDAVDLANGGDTVVVNPGPYPDLVTMPAATPLTLVGTGMTQTFLTGGMILADGVDGITLQQFAISGEGTAGAVIRASGYNNDFTMDHVLLDGEGATYPSRHSYAGGRTTGDVTITNCEFQNVAGWSVFDCSTSGWETVMGTVTFANNYIHDCDGAVAFRGDNTDRIDHALVHDNVWQDINDNWNAHGTVENAWACIEVHGVVDLQFYANTMTDVHESKWSEGQGLQAWRVGAVDIHDNAFTSCWQGIWLPGLGTEPAPSGGIHANSFVGTIDKAVFMTHSGGGYTSGVLDAEYNWWGDATGPLDASDDTATGGLYNPGGLGGAVSDYVDYEPWTGMGSFTVTPAATGPVMCGETHTLTFSLTTDDYTPDVFGFNAVVRATNVTWGAIHSLDPFGTTTQFLTSNNGDGSWTISGTTIGSPSQPISGAGTYGLFTIDFTTATEGTADITFDSFSLRDPNNAPIPATATGATIVIDCTAPDPVTDITAAPRHNKVDVSWSHPDPSDVDHYEVYRGLWYDTTVGNSAYPEYDDVGAIAPTRPTGYGVFPGPANEWVTVDDGALAAMTFTDGVTHTFPAGRGVYYYEVFAVDAAGNGSGPAAANDRATNYWLGDVSPTDGSVDVGDMTRLGTYFGTTIATGDPGNDTDVGPTDDWSRLGIPTTDSKVDFEDLMVFSMNFGVVTGAKTMAPLSSSVDLAWVANDDGTMALRLVDGSGLKGVHVTANQPVSKVTAGKLLDDQSELTFLRNVGTNLDASVAVMGINNGFSGQGDLMVVSAEDPIAVENLKITARGIDNSTLKVNLTQTTGTATPRVFSLNANYPNPFNPMTKISFSLPEAQNVDLVVFGIDGKRVATLMHGQQEAGLHEVIWQGRDDNGKSVATGTYFYQIKAGPYSQVRKMTLIK